MRWPWAWVPLCAVSGVMLNYGNPAPFLALAFLAGVAFLILAPTGALAATAICVSVVTVSAPKVVEFGDISVTLADLVLVGVSCACLLRGSPAARSRLWWLTAAVVGWAVVRSAVGELGPIVSFLRTTQPLIVALLLARLDLGDFEPLQWLRRASFVVCLTIPMYTQGALRASSVAGDPVSTGLVAAVLVLLSLGKSRSGVAVGIYGLLASKSLSSALAVVVALGARAAIGSGVHRRISPLLVIPAGCVLVSLVVILRAGSLTINVHLAQAEAFFPVFSKLNPIIGGGFGASPKLVDQINYLNIPTLHNVYLQWIADLGLVGFVIFAVWLWHLGRVAEVTAVVVVAAVWMNTTGVYPDPAWAVLAACLLNALLVDRRRATAPNLEEGDPTEVRT